MTSANIHYPDNAQNDSALFQSAQASLFPQEPFTVAAAMEVDAALAVQAPVYIGVSGGKDSQALAYRVCAHLDAIGHRGQRALIHSDLGRVEWRDSSSVCERIADRLGLELLVVRRQAGDMMDRWLSRWDGNVARYRDLACVKLILPWSTASQRFCTSELKSQVIASAIRKRHPTGPVISAVGIRWQESTARARMPVWKRDQRLTRRTGPGLTWHPIIHWQRDDVIDYIHRRGDMLHEAYRLYDSSRVSCAFCILASRGDLAAAARCLDNAAIYREMVALEIRSTFSFQGGAWLGDVAPSLLDASTRAELAEARERAAERQAAERMIPQHLLYEGGRPTCLPSMGEAALLANVRRRVAQAVRIEADFIDPCAIIERYRFLLAAC